MSVVPFAIQAQIDECKRLFVTPNPHRCDRCEAHSQCDYLKGKMDAYFQRASDLKKTKDLLLSPGNPMQTIRPRCSKCGSVMIRNHMTSTYACANSYREDHSD